MSRKRKTERQRAERMQSGFTIKVKMRRGTHWTSVQKGTTGTRETENDRKQI